MAGLKQESWVSLFGHLLTAAGIVIGIWQFNKANERDDRVQFQRHMWEKKLDLYTQLTNNTADYLMASGATEIAVLDKQLDKLYFTFLFVKPSKNVEEKLIAFRAEAKDFKDQLSNAQRLKPKQQALLNACQEDLKESWEGLGF